MSDIYDDPAFFKAYSQMDRSKKGLAGAGEWHELKTVLPDFKSSFTCLYMPFVWLCIYLLPCNKCKSFVFSILLCLHCNISFS